MGEEFFWKFHNWRKPPVIGQWVIFNKLSWHKLSVLPSNSSSCVSPYFQMAWPQLHSSNLNKQLVTFSQTVESEDFKATHQFCFIRCFTNYVHWPYFHCVSLYCSLLEEFNECVNSTGYSDYNIPAYVHHFMRKQITMSLKKRCFLGLPSEFYTFLQLWVSQPKL